MTRSRCTTLLGILLGTVFGCRSLPTEELLREANASFEEEKYEAAFALYSRILEEEPGHVEALNNRGMTRFRRGDIPGAITDYDACAVAAPRFAECFYNRGVAHFALGESDRAIRDYTQAISLHAKYARAYAARGHAHAQEGRADDAIRDFGKALEAAPESWPERDAVMTELKRVVESKTPEKNK